jgi:hypothetical protein
VTAARMPRIKAGPQQRHGCRAASRLAPAALRTQVQIAHCDQQLLQGLGLNLNPALQRPQARGNTTSAQALHSDWPVCLAMYHMAVVAYVHTASPGCACALCLLC